MHSLALLSALSLAATSAVAVPAPAVAAPQRRQDGPGSFSVPLFRRNVKKREGRELVEWASRVRVGAHVKYNRPLSSHSASKRASSGPVQLFDITRDSEYVGVVSVGTPAQSHVVILDTGSADFWLAGSNCEQGCDGTPTYDPSASSSSTESSNSFQVEYGSGAAAGVLVKDTVSIAGMAVDGQIFGVADQVSAQMLEGSISGLLGLGWQAIASSGATPLVQALYQSGDLSSPVMQFALTRFQDDNKAGSVEPGGIMTVGATNSSLYSGSINYIDLTSKSYWLIPVEGATVNGNAVTLSETGAAIDTGTSLIGGPPADVQAIYSQIPGAAASSDPSMEGYWTFPCSSTLNVSFTFGGVSYPISADDFNLGRDGSSCVGAIFELQGSTGSGQGVPSWIFGDSFLKNVVSFYQFSPAAVGFATPNEDARQALEDDTAATKGLASVTGTAAGAGPSGSGSGDGGFPSSARPTASLSLALAVTLCSAAVALLA